MSDLISGIADSTFRATGETRCHVNINVAVFKMKPCCLFKVTRSVWPCIELAAGPGCLSASALWQPGEAPAEPGDPELRKMKNE